MFIGHYAVGLAAKRAAPKTSLGTLILASQLVDLLWPILLIFGIEHVKVSPGNTVVTPLEFYDYPITHSLFGALGWSIFLGLFYFYIRREYKSSLIIGLCVFSHWILDYITHGPDLPLSPGSDKLFGLGLWNSLSGTLVVEVGLFVIGVSMYLNSTKAKDKSGIYGFWSLIILLSLMYAGNILNTSPPNESVIPYLGLGGWLFVPWAYWIDRHREMRV